jgi:hypothetical protein
MLFVSPGLVFAFFAGFAFVSSAVFAHAFFGGGFECEVGE